MSKLEELCVPFSVKVELLNELLIKKYETLTSLHNSMVNYRSVYNNVDNDPQHDVYTHKLKNIRIGLKVIEQFWYNDRHILERIETLNELKKHQEKSENASMFMFNIKQLYKLMHDKTIEFNIVQAYKE